MSLLAACASGGDPPPVPDATAEGGGGMDGGPTDATPMLDAPPVPDGGGGLALTCEACTTDADCEAGYCAPLTSGGSACLPSCNIDLPDCPARFECVANFTSSIPEPICAPVGERCCVDEDGDLFGGGVGCFGVDCNDADPDINGDGIEMCDGVDQNCDGTPDDGDPAILCPRGSHVASTACVGGGCEIEACEPGFDDCNSMAADGCETNIESPTDCGSCGENCMLANVAVGDCDMGACRIILCEPGFGDCNGVAVDGCEQPLTTSTHCAGCGVVCGLPNATSTCASGTCEVGTCDRNWGDCNGADPDGCETPLITNADCGSCGTICAPAGGTGECSTGTCRVTTCGSGFEDCNMSTADGCETSIRTLSNCGACGVVCTYPNGVASCAPPCTLTDCVPGYGNCDGITGNGCETRVNTATSCGACGVPCAPAHATGDCATGMCTITMCDAGWANCDGLVANGCETSLRTTTDCGSCGTACVRAGAVADCSTMSCMIGTCVTGFGDCDGSDATGCETSLRTTMDCGACGIACARPHATASCGSGICGISSCDTDYANCDGADSNGCETSLTTVTSCGGCGIACSRANAIADCSTGTCRIGSCNAGFANCDGVDVNGCETPLNTLTNCGGCGMACSLPNAGESCASGTCEITTCASNFDDCDSNDANGCETSLRTLANCGGCGVACSRPNATASCTTGTCTVASCNGGFGNCDGSDTNGCEASLSTLSNCGSCGATCDLANAAESCPSGTCTLGTCASDWGNCDGTTSNGCETPLTTLANCGGCGTGCNLANATETCSTGSCEVAMCASGFGDCDGIASNGCERSTHTLTDCGSCGVPCTRVGATATCTTGTCSIDSCNSGRGNCDAVDSNGCETLLTTLMDCGACGSTCDLPNATESCSSGTCTLGACASDFGNCDMSTPNGCETPLTTLANCGSCGVPCDLPGAGESCATGMCELSGCSPGFADCNMAGADGCETSITTVMNCGGCAIPCNLPHATETCSTGTCAIVSCDAGWGNCDGIAANGCESPLDTLTNCGSCGNDCDLSNATESCGTGTCAIVSCDSGFGNCDSMTANGCETSLTTLTNCGTCGTGCSLPNANESCATGSCTVTSCTSGFGNCDGVSSNGCEVNTQTSIANCGSCGSTCSPANATGMCVGGSCGIASCDTGWGNCNGSAVDGCETPLNTLGNCGSCGTACSLANASESCAGGTCQIVSCSAGFGDCDMSAANGCEQPLNTLSHCAACNTSCSRPNATATCGSGSCAVSSCNANFGNCDGMDPNGCETNTTNTVAHCGGCGNNCNTMSHPNTTAIACSASTCTINGCSSSWFDQDGVFTTGCECMADVFANACASPTALGSISIGGSAIMQTGNLVGTGDNDWFTVTFGTAASCAYHPRVTISNGGEPIAFRVLTSCAGAGFACAPAEGGTSASSPVTVWEHLNDASCGDLLSIDPTPASGTYITTPTTVLIHVAATGSSPTCLPYTLTVTN